MISGVAVSHRNRALFSQREMAQSDVDATSLRIAREQQASAACC